MMNQTEVQADLVTQEQYNGMKKLVIIAVLFFCMLAGCRTTKKISKVIAPRDSSYVKINTSVADSIILLKKTIADFKNTFIDFKTFSSKIKVDIEDSKGKQPDLTAVVRIIKDSAIWISVSATFLNFEVYRVFIDKKRVILVNKQDKEVQYRTLDYLQEVTQIPFDYKTVENLLIGNPVFYTDNILSFRKNENYITLLTLGEYFKHLLTLSADTKTLVYSKLVDIDVFRNRTADISYTDYDNVDGFNFSNSRHIAVSEKTKLDIKLRFKQVEFNKDLSVSFNIPRNYKSK